MSRLLHCFPCLLVITCLLVAVPVAQATIIHSDVAGATVVFTGISEGSPTGDPEPLFGQPAAAGDTLVFPTTASFSASSLDGDASDQTDGKLNLMVRAKPGFALTGLSILESGLTELDAPFRGGDAFTRVSSLAVVKVVEIAGAPVSLTPSLTFLIFMPQNQYQLSVLGVPTYSTGWSGSASIPLPLDTTKVLITLDNNLFAATLGPGTRAFIDKKTFEIDIDTDDLIPNDIPEPATFLLGLGALVGLNISTFRRKGAI